MGEERKDVAAETGPDPAPSAVEPAEPTYETQEPSDSPPWVEAEIAELNDRTVDELRERAKSLGLSGYSDATKDALVKDVRSHLRKSPPPEPRIG